MLALLLIIILSGELVSALGCGGIVRVARIRAVRVQREVSR